MVVINELIKIISYCLIIVIIFYLAQIKWFTVHKIYYSTETNRGVLCTFINEKIDFLKYDVACFNESFNKNQ